MILPLCSYRKTFFIYTALFFLLTILLVSCQNSKKEIQDLNSSKLGVEVVKDVDINYTLGGTAKAKLLSPLMLRVQENVPYVEFPQKLHVDFFSEAAIVESMLDANYGKYTETESKVYLRDSVKFIGLENGDTLYCDELYWDRNRPVYQFYTDKPVQIRTKSQIIYGEGGFETNQDFTEKVVKRVVNSIIRVPTSQFPGN
jgi:hypothetical protein